MFCASKSSKIKIELMDFQAPEELHQLHVDVEMCMSGILLATDF